MPYEMEKKQNGSGIWIIEPNIASLLCNRMWDSKIFKIALASWYSSNLGHIVQQNIWKSLAGNYLVDIIYYWTLNDELFTQAMDKATVGIWGFHYNTATCINYNLLWNNQGGNWM